MMSSLARLVVRRRRAVILIWIALLIGAGTVGSSAFSVLSSSFGAGPSTESGRVTQRLDDLAGTGGEIAIIADGIDVDEQWTTFGAYGAITFAFLQSTIIDRFVPKAVQS